MKDFLLYVTDDDDDDFFLIRETFNELIRHEFRRFKDGQFLIENLNELVKAKESFPDIIILDINMPRLDGVSTLRLIKASEKLKVIPIIIYSTSSSQELMKECLALGANGFISKGSHHQQIVSFANSVNNFLKALRSDPSSQFVHK